VSACMEKKLRPAKVLLSQGMGFVALIAISWVNELIDLRSLVLGDHPYISDFRESTLEMLFVLAVWLVVYGSTNRMLARMNQLEGFLHLCSWCRRIGTKGRWMSTEEFFDRRFDTKTSHGICEECMKEQEAALANAKRQLQLPTFDSSSAPPP
jgi:hypothetical protein